MRMEKDGLVRYLGEGNGKPLQYSWASLVAQLVKNRAAFLPHAPPRASWDHLPREILAPEPSSQPLHPVRDRLALQGGTGDYP